VITCDHGCEREATVEHANGRMLCQPCYMVETASDEYLRRAMREQDWFCPTCRIDGGGRVEFEDDPNEGLGFDPLYGGCNPEPSQGAYGNG